jgi:hypothetical protein
MNKNLKAFVTRKLIRVFFAIALLTALGITNLQSQNTLYIQEKATQSSFALNSIRKVTFPSGNLLVHKTDGNTSNFMLSDLCHMSFYISTTEEAPMEINDKNNFSIFPNPATIKLQVDFEGTKAEKVRFEIVNMQGKVLLQQSITCQCGKNIFTLSTAHLAVGLYLLRMHNDTKIETIKFYKN